MGIVGGTLSGEAVSKRRSPFADRMGETIASPLVSMIEDPTDARSFSADTHDGEGLACRPTALIADGVLQGFLHNTLHGPAPRRGVDRVGRAGRAQHARASVRSHCSWRRERKRPRRCWRRSTSASSCSRSRACTRASTPISGDFSVGVEGLMIRNGALAEPIREATLGSTIQRLLTDIIAVGSDLEWLPGGYGAATLVIDGVTLSGSLSLAVIDGPGQRNEVDKITSTAMPAATR